MGLILKGGSIGLDNQYFLLFLFLNAFFTFIVLCILYYGHRHKWFTRHKARSLDSSFSHEIPENIYTTGYTPPTNL
jgi:hypothetical protein